VRWLGGNRVRRDAEAALAVLEDYERRIYSGEMHIRIEKGIKGRFCIAPCSGKRMWAMLAS